MLFRDFCQCVELVRRYIYKKHNINLARKWRNGNACDWLDNIDSMGLVQISPENAREGDIVTFTGGLYGHIGLLIKEGEGLYMVSQNFYNDSRDIKTFLPPEIFNRKSSLQPCNNKYHFQSILRIKGRSAKELRPSRPQG